MSLHLKSVTILSLSSLIILGSSIGFTTSAASNNNVLQSREISALFPGVFVGYVDNSMRIKVAAKRNGTLKGWVMGVSDKGHWRVSKGRFCVKWQSWGNGKEYCGKIYRNGQWLEAAVGKKLKLKKV